MNDIYVQVSRKRASLHVLSTGDYLEITGSLIIFTGPTHQPKGGRCNWVQRRVQG